MAREFEEVDVRVGGEILTIRVPKGTPDEVIKQRVRELEARPSQRPTPLRGAGTVRIFGVPGTSRAGVRGAVEALPAPLRFAAEAGPSIAGTVAGTVAGGLAAPFTAGIVNPLTGSVAGGVAGELLAQETGLAPESTLGLVASGAGPVIGPGAVRGARFAARRIAGLPGVREAAQVIGLERASEQLLETGATLLAKGQGLLRHSADKLYGAVRRAGVQITPARLTSTLSALDDLAAEVRPFRSRPEGRQILRTIETIQKDLGVRRPSVQAGPMLTALTLGPPITTTRTVIPPDIEFADLMRIRQLVGADVGAFERAAGVKLGAGKKMFGALAEDIDRLAAAPGASGRVARLSKAAAERAKLEFSVADFDALIRANSRAFDVAGQRTEIIDMSAVLRRLKAMSDPKSGGFDKNFTAALKGELPAIEQFLEKNAKLLTRTGRGGELVLRGATARFTRGLIGGAMGLLTGGAVGPMSAAGGALAGGIIGARAPDILASSLLRPGGRVALQRLIDFGGGQIDERGLAILSQVLTQATTREPGREFIGEMVPTPLADIEGFIERVGPMIPERFRTPLSGLRIGGEPEP